jgi:hypothetical protein
LELAIFFSASNGFCISQPEVSAPLFLLFFAEIHFQQKRARKVELKLKLFFSVQ